VSRKKFRINAVISSRGNFITAKVEQKGRKAGPSLSYLLRDHFVRKPRREVDVPSSSNGSALTVDYPLSSDHFPDEQRVTPEVDTVARHVPALRLLTLTPSLRNFDVSHFSVLLHDPCIPMVERGKKKDRNFFAGIMEENITALFIAAFTPGLFRH
jgi:hypothetical protein